MVVGIGGGSLVVLAAAVALAGPRVAQQDRHEGPRRAVPPAVRGIPMTQATGRTLPDANGRTFATLDAYLGHLRSHAAPMDRPWYREIKPGLFRLETGNFRPLDEAAEPRVFTRAELERRFGFEK